MTARKNDLVVVETTHSSYVIGQGHTERTEYSFGLVASATRDGQVKTYRDIGYGNELVSPYAQPIRHSRCYVMPRDSIDVAAVLRAAKAHHWPGHPGQPMAFGSLDEARAVARAHLLAA